MTGSDYDMKADSPPSHEKLRRSVSFFLTDKVTTCVLQSPDNFKMPRCELLSPGDMSCNGFICRERKKESMTPVYVTILLKGLVFELI